MSEIKIEDASEYEEFIESTARSIATEVDIDESARPTFVFEVMHAPVQRAVSRDDIDFDTSQRIRQEFGNSDPGREAQKMAGGSPEQQSRELAASILRRDLIDRTAEIAGVEVEKPA